MMPWLARHTANPTGSHRAAREARRAVDEAREQLAAVLHVQPDEIVFTSGGTESDNLAVAGACEAFDPPTSTPVCSAIEHPAVLEPVRRRGGTTVGVDRRGRLDLDELARVLAERPADPLLGPTPLVSVMAVNNEVGTIQPVVEAASIVREHAPGAMVHCDAIQALAWVDLTAVAASVDLMSLSGHKLGGPMGVGALTWRRGARMVAQQWGGGQERERRAGTPNVAGIVGLALAAAMCHDERAATVMRVGAQRDRLVDGLTAKIDGLVETGVDDGDRSHKVAANAHVCIAGVEAEALLFLLDRDGVAASAASSCASGAQDPSHVLAAMGVDRALAGGSLRLSLGWNTTDDEIDDALEAIPHAVASLRSTGS